MQSFSFRIELKQNCARIISKCFGVLQRLRDIVLPGIITNPSEAAWFSLSSFLENFYCWFYVCHNAFLIAHFIVLVVQVLVNKNTASASEIVSCSDNDISCHTESSLPCNVELISVYGFR